MKAPVINGSVNMVSVAQVDAKSIFWIYGKNKSDI